MQIVHAESAEQVEQIRGLLDEYWSSFHFARCFQNFDAEVAGLPGAYARPDGRLALALVGGNAAGCIAFRRFDASRCEAKRLYVRPEYRGLGLGRALLKWLIGEARSAGYREIVGHTLPLMANAVELYDRLGFERYTPSGGKAAPDAIYLRMSL